MNYPRHTHPRAAEWTYRSLRSNHERTARLHLVYEMNGSAMSDEWEPDEISAEALFRKYLRRYVPDSGEVSIAWFVMSEDGGVCEYAPFQHDSFSFLQTYTWPEDSNGNRVNWNRLWIEPGAWNTEHHTKGGFLYEATRYLPAVFQQSVNIRTVARAAGL